MDGIRNFRELGGLRGADGASVRSGQIFRSGHLANATDADLALLANAGLAAVIDLRSDEDVVGDGEDRLPDGVAYHQVPTFDEGGRSAEVRAVIMSGDAQLIEATFGGGKAEALALAGAQRMVDGEQQCVRFAEAMQIVLEATSRPVLFHCSAGKDRAGWLATIIAMTLGVDRPQLIEHYLESNRTSDWQFLKDDPAIAPARPLLEVQAAYADAALDRMHDLFGTVDGYLFDGLGLNADAVTAFRASALEAAPTVDA